jgi:transcriptional regulator with XRE-family HTH domain
MSEPHERLDQAMNTRRLDLGKQWKDIAGEAGISTAALGAIRRGEYRPSQLNARRLEDALQWAHGSIETVYADGEPTPIRRSPSERVQAMQERFDRIVAGGEPEDIQALDTIMRGMDPGDPASQTG